MNQVSKLSSVRFDLPSDTYGPEGESGRGMHLSNSGGLNLVDNADAIRQGIMMLLSTRPGERVMRPDYGCPLHRLAFEPNDAATAGLAMHYIRSSLRKWEPRISIASLTVQQMDDTESEPNQLTVRLDYQVKTTGEAGQLEFDLDLQA